MAEEIKRLYSMEDELMLERAGTQKGNLLADAALFAAKFPWIDAAYINSYGTDIATADAVPLDGTVMSDMKVLTSDVNATVEEGRTALQSLFRYAKITYPTDSARENVFGQSQMDKARTDQNKMENLLEHANGMANKVPYKTDLQAKGYQLAQIANLLTISDNINIKNMLQEAAKSNRPVSSQDRLKVYNIVFSRGNTIRICAEEVFAGNAAKIEQYRMYPPSGAATSLVVHITDGANNMAGLSVQVLGTTIAPQITDATGTTPAFDLGSNPTDTVDIEVSGAGINPTPQTFTNQDITDGVSNALEIVVTV
jgi:hypothetical protein